MTRRTALGLWALLFLAIAAACAILFVLENT